MFHRSAPHVKTPQEWAALSGNLKGSRFVSARATEAGARRYARENMVAVVMHADDTATAFLFDAESGRVVKRPRAAVAWVG